MSASEWALLQDELEEQKRQNEIMRNAITDELSLLDKQIELLKLRQSENVAAFEPILPLASALWRLSKRLKETLEKAKEQV